MPQRSNRELSGGIESCQPLSNIIDPKLEYPVDIWDSELGSEFSIVVYHCLSHERINPINVHEID